MGDKEFHELLGIIVDSNEQDVTRTIVQAADYRAKEQVLKNLARQNGIDPNNLTPQDIGDILKIINEIHIIKGRVSLMSPRS
jgi:hypothetical protein